ncbi:hypothetical protein BN1195_03630 [Chryseobacterium oranimense G311]|uniref:hypothetical protein n=1 Tax=Chryseobacterium oranimense TaxID=421058 RepID=UPI00053373F7|nr:hypothetical protein [Chryseobacterium oranimense]CEJ71285.1 hypothetical protein BN1195_03630 [Chryseobacterium oranimense G311]DAG72851.1 MAG TPA: hypothetical protein [Caudoviricetes sp.]
MENHKEKQEIFDKYAKSREFEDWNDLKNCCIEFDIDIDEYIFDACDLVQAEQQERIAESTKMKYHDGVSKVDHHLTYFQSGADNIQIDKDTITNPENFIK